MPRVVTAGVPTRMPLAAQDGRNQVGERLAGTGARLTEQRAAVLNDVGDGGSHLALAVARLVAVEYARQGAGFSEGGSDLVDQR